MRLAGTTFLLGITLLFGSCSGPKKKLTLTAYTPGSDSYQSALAIKEALHEEGWDITLISQRHEEGVEALRKGKVDLAITSNDISVDGTGLRTIIPLYKEVLVTLVREDSPILDWKSIDEILGVIELNKPTILFTYEGSYPHRFAERIIHLQGIKPDQYYSVFFKEHENFNDGKLEMVKSLMPDMVYLLGNMDNEIVGKLMDLGYIFENLENQIDNIEASYITSYADQMPRSFPVVVPTYTFSFKQSEPVVTLGLYTSLIANKTLDEATTYELAKDLMKVQPDLIKINHNFFDMSESFDRRMLNYKIHRGALSYFERDKPSIYERYAELSGVLFSMLVVVIGFIASMNRIVKQRKKDRIDVYYLEVLKIRKNGNYQEAMEQLLALETKALEQLVDEKLAADSSFIVFMHQLSQARLELGDKLS